MHPTKESDTPSTPLDIHATGFQSLTATQQTTYDSDMINNHGETTETSVGTTNHHIITTEQDVSPAEDTTLPTSMRSETTDENPVMSTKIDSTTGVSVQSKDDNILQTTTVNPESTEQNTLTHSNDDINSNMTMLRHTTLEINATSDITVHPSVLSDESTNDKTTMDTDLANARTVDVTDLSDTTINAELGDLSGTTHKPSEMIASTIQFTKNAINEESTQTNKFITEDRIYEPTTKILSQTTDDLSTLHSTTVDITLFTSAGASDITSSETTNSFTSDFDNNNAAENFSSSQSVSGSTTITSVSSELTTSNDATASSEASGGELTNASSGDGPYSTFSTSDVETSTMQNTKSTISGNISFSYNYYH